LICLQRHAALPVFVGLSWYVVGQASSPIAEEYVTRHVLPLFDGLAAKSKIPFFVLAIGFLFTHFTKIPVYVAQSNEGKGYDNKKPRDQQTRLKGWGARALASHVNAFEAFPAFAIAVIAAHVTQVPLGIQINLTVLWLLCRVAFTIFYIINIDALRSIVWFISTSTIAKLFLLAAK